MQGASHESGRLGGLSRSRPPGPKGHLLIGNLFDYTRDRLGFLVRCARESGDVVRLRFIKVQTYLLNHPDHIEYGLVRNNHNFWSSKSPCGSTRRPRPLDERP